jgi:hypothetical protein
MSGALGAQEITAALTACASEIGAPPGDLEKLGDLIANTMQLQTVPAFLADHSTALRPRKAERKDSC